jgi:superfamily II DNA/RNA helicase
MAFLELVRSAIAVKDKTLVFSHSLPTLDYLESVLRTEDIQYLRLDGQTKSERRPSMIKNFNRDEGPSVFLISTTAGGEGTNMYGANRVIIFDFRFNPSKEEQAIGRAYRLGQTKPVYVYRLITDGTTEAHLLNINGFKMQLSYKVNEKKNFNSAFTKSVRDYMFKAKEVPSLGNMDEFRKLNDKMLDRLIDRHQSQPFITALESIDKYRIEERLELTADEEKQIENLLEEERLGKRSLHTDDIPHHANIPKKQHYPSSVRNDGPAISSQALASSVYQSGMANQDKPSSQPAASTQTARRHLSYPKSANTSEDGIVSRSRELYPSQKAPISEKMVRSATNGSEQTTPYAPLDKGNSFDLDNRVPDPLGNKANKPKLFQSAESSSVDKETQKQRLEEYLQLVQNKPEFQSQPTLNQAYHKRQLSDSGGVS